MLIDWIKEYAPILSTAKTFFEILKYAPEVVKKMQSSMRDFKEDNDLNINEVYQKLENGSINMASNIYTSGYLLQYGQIFEPYTYTKGLFSPASQKDVEDFNEKHKGTMHELRKGEILFQKKDFIMPTKKLNPYNNVGCAFLYDEKFNGFYSKENKGKNIYAKPMLVLYDVNQHTKYLNHKIELKGKLCIVPKEISKRLDLTYNDTLRSICQNFYRPFNESNNLICISLLPEDAKIRCQKNSDIREYVSNIELPIFMEAKIDQVMQKEIPEKVIESFLPNTYRKYFGIEIPTPAMRIEGDKAITFPSTSNINVAYRNGNIGFYMNTSLTDRERYTSDLEQYVRYVNNFAIDYKNFCKKEIGNAGKMEITFISDDTKRDLFLGKYSACMFKGDGFKDLPETEWMLNI